jgi:spermidine synthase
VLSGAAALSHQLLWTQRMTDLLGSSVESTTRVFGCFFLGLSLGAGMIALYIGRISRPWRAMALAEFGVALFCLPVLGLSGWADWIWPWLGNEGLLGWQGTLIKLGLSMVVIFLPAFAMGMVFPLLVKGVVAESGSESATGGWLYAANTAGGVIGLGVTAGYALYSLGVSGALWLALLLNVIVGLLAYWIDRQSNRGEGKKAIIVSTFVGLNLLKALGWKLILTSFLSGAVILGLEILAMELVMLVAPLSFYAPVAVLASFILALAVSAGLIPVIGKFVATSKTFLFGVLVAAGLTTVIAPISLVRKVIESGGLQTFEGLFGFTVSLSGLVLLSLGPGLLIAGTVFPTLLRMLPKQCNRSAAIGTLLAVNGFGGLVGAEWAYRVLVPWVGIYLGMGVVALVYVLAAGLWMGEAGPQLWIKRCCLVFCVCFVSVVSAVSLRHLPVVNPNIGLEVLDLKMGREGNLAVVEHESFGRGLLFSNQYLLGSTNVRYDQERQAHVPLLLHPEPKQVCFLGLATGITPSAALQHSTIESIEIVELSRMVVEAAGEFFSEFNAGITESPAARILVEDGRTFIASQPNQYDVVVGDLFLPWRAGVGRLYSVEHLQAVKASLRSDGLFCQWLPLYQFTAAQLELVLCTFQSVFPKTYLFEGKLELGAPVLAMIGYRDGDLNWQLVERACNRERQVNRIKDPTVRHVEGLSMLFRGALDETEGTTEINSLNNMELELQAGLHRILDGAGKDYLVGDKWLRQSESLLVNAASHLAQSNFDSLKENPQRGKQISLFREGLSRPKADRNAIMKRVFALIPTSMRGDRLGDWKKWAGPEIAVRWRPLDGEQGDAEKE